MVEFQIPVLLGDNGKEAEADTITAEDEAEDDVVAVDAVVEAAVDDEEEMEDEEDVEDVELEVVDVTGFFAQSQSVS